MPGLYKKRGFFKRGVKREAAAILQDLHLEDADFLGEMESTILYFEFRNAAKRYLSTCNNAQYGKNFFGLKSINDEEKKLLACEEIWLIGRGMPALFGEEERMRLWGNALYDELMQYDKSLKPYYETLEQGNIKLR